MDIQFIYVHKEKKNINAMESVILMIKKEISIEKNIIWRYVIVRKNNVFVIEVKKIILMTKIVTFIIILVDDKKKQCKLALGHTNPLLIN